MPVNNSKADEPRDFSARDDSYKSGAGEINAGKNADTTTAAETFDRIGSAAAEFNDYQTKPLDSNIASLPVNSSDDVINDDSPMSRLIPLIVVFLLIILGYSFCSKLPEAKAAGQNGFVMAKANII